MVVGLEGNEEKKALGQNLETAPDEEILGECCSSMQRLPLYGAVEVYRSVRDTSVHRYASGAFSISRARPSLASAAARTSRSSYFVAPASCARKC